MVTLELRLQNLTQKEYTLQEGDTLTIGRHFGNDIVISEPTVSRRHACIAWKGRKLTVCDEGSTNGVSLNGKKIRSANLKDGDIVSIGVKYNLKTSIVSSRKRELTMTA